ncbi:RDD family protein [Qipengyuania sp. JC766]|uniref:RDD family protein n=1 Tax=Qipengyuania sp. JC766 TaxID=3232139 RepID=UPI003457546D
MSDVLAPHLAHTAKRRRTRITPEGVALPFTVATRGARAGAFILDYFILMAGAVLFTLLLGTFYSRLGLSGSINGSGEFIVILWTLFWFVAWNGYFMIMELSPRGATWGKRAVGIRVAARDGTRLTPEAVIARNLVRDIELFLPLVLIMTNSFFGGSGPAGWAGLAWFLVFLLFPFFNKDALRAGDVIAGTWVVEKPKIKLADALSAEGAARAGKSAVTGAKYEFGEEELAVYGEYELQTLERVLREGRPDAMDAVTDAICNKIGWNPGKGDERAFLESFYAQLRARLENDMRFGKRKADKYS